MAPMAHGGWHVHAEEAAVSAAPSISQGSAAFLGATYGLLHIIGPDHLGTLMTLSLATSPRRAFSVGAYWSLGHCAGMVIVAVAVVALQKLTRVDVETWEHYGDYVIGASMILCGLYFIWREGEYMEQRADGSHALRPCSCHGGHHAGHVHGRHSPGSRGTSRRSTALGGACAAFAKAKQERGCEGGKSSDFSSTECCSDPEHAEAETHPLIPGGGHSGAAHARDDDGDSGGLWDKLLSTRDLRSALLGILQGMCCPMGLVGIAFLATLPTVGIGIFLITFLLVSALGTGALASGWAWLLTNQLVSDKFSAHLTYRASCFFTLVLGAAWILANACGFLDRLNYAEHHSGAAMPAML